MSPPHVADTSLDPTTHDLWGRARGPIAIALVVLLGSLILAVVASGERAGALDPRAADRAGSKALAEVLRGQGVQVDLVETTDAAVAAATEGSTLLVAIPDLLVELQLERLAKTPADLVLVSPGDAALSALAPGIRTIEGSEPVVGGDGSERQPVCGFGVAQRAGAADAGGFEYEADQPREGVVHLCYPRGNDASLVRRETPGARTVTVLGSPAILTNRRLGEQGNAALALGLLGENPRLVWYLPSYADIPAGGQKSLTDLIPGGVKFGVVQLLVALGVLALWRGRRLGPVVEEPLPVVVRAAETVEGRSRLYRKAGARDVAADALRRAAIRRLGAALSLPRRAAPGEVVAAVASRTGRPAGDVGALLYGAAPTDDGGLVTLADALDSVDREVRRS